MPFRHCFDVIACTRPSRGPQPEQRWSVVTVFGLGSQEPSRAVLKTSEAGMRTCRQAVSLGGHQTGPRDVVARGPSLLGPKSSPRQSLWRSPLPVATVVSRTTTSRAWSDAEGPMAHENCLASVFCLFSISYSSVYDCWSALFCFPCCFLCVLLSFLIWL